jgi:hypothetical protein
MKYLLIVTSLFYSLIQTHVTVKPVRTGSHSFTIQWISFNKSTPGKVSIKKIGDEEYSIQGEQRDLNQTNTSPSKELS